MRLGWVAPQTDRGGGTHGSKLRWSRDAMLLSASAALCLPAYEPLPPRYPRRRVIVHNCWDQVVPYAEALAWQRQLRDERVQFLRERKPQLPDALLLMQHPPVLTLGTSR